PQVTVRFGRPLRAAPGEDVRAFTARLAAEVDRLCAEDATSWWDATRAALAEQPADSPADSSGGAANAAGAAPRQPAAADRDGDGDGDGDGEDSSVGGPSADGAAMTAVGEARTLGRHRPRAGVRPGAGPVSISARLRGAPATPTARWRRIWAATEPLPRNTSRSPWRR
ncbi:1-acyl-sn-glycerol-3-phosphate acyltransferase, partial [Candidatus Frankia alpina]